MNKVTTLLMVILLMIALCMWGCSATPIEPAMVGKGDADPGLEKVLVVPEDYFSLEGKQVFLTYSSVDSGEAYFSLISASPLSEEDIGIEIAGKVLNPSEYRFHFYGQPDRFELPYYVYQTFRGKDWKTECQLQLEYKHAQKAMEENLENREALLKAASALKASQNEHLEDYELLREQNKLPKLYRYTLSIDMPKDEILCDVSITEIILRVKGREETFPVGEIKYVGHEDKNMFSLQSLIPSRFAVGWTIATSIKNGASIIADGYGNIILRNLGTYHLRAKENLAVTGIRLWADSRQLSDIHAIISIPNKDGATYDEAGKEIHNIVADYIWDGETPIWVEAGQELSIDAVIHDPRLINAVWGYTHFAIAFYYENAEGEQGVVLQDYPVQIQTISGNPFETYLQYELGINAMSYYTDYYSILDTEEYGGVTIVDDIS